MERLGEQGEPIALHLLSVLDPVVRSGDASSQLMSGSKRWRLMFQLAVLLLKADSPQLRCAVLGTGFESTELRFAFERPFFAELDLFLWSRIDVSDDDATHQVVVATTNGIKRVILQSLPDMQVTSLCVITIKALNAP